MAVPMLTTRTVGTRSVASGTTKLTFAVIINMLMLLIWAIRAVPI
jgi:hypothetical protein